MQNTVLFVGALPPPINGKSLIHERVHSLLRPRCRLITINLSSGRLERSLAYHFQRLFRVLAGIGIVLLNAGDGHRLYLTVDAGWGLVYNAIIVAFARLARHSIFLHYHSFSFIDRRSRLMVWLVRVSGKYATHIFLCDRMRERFKDEYAFEGPSLVCSNALGAPPKKAGAHQFAGTLRLGLLSNLNAEKGLHDFLALLRAAKVRKIAVSGVLAGPPVSEADEEAISTARCELGDYLDYRGPLYGEAKDAFYDEIDAFLFPTRYRVEAQPVVLFEALAHGVPVISYDRGCIASDINDDDAGYIIPANADFITNALARIEHWLAEPKGFMASRAAAARLYRRLYDSGEGGFPSLIAALTEPPTVPVALQAQP